MVDTISSTSASGSSHSRSCLSWRDSLVTNLRLLGFNSPGRIGYDGDIHITRDLFQRPNKRAFQAVILFLFETLDKAEMARRFECCRRCLTRRQEVDFAKICCAWLSELAEEGRLPRVTPSLVACPQGEKIYEVLTKLSTVVLRRRMLSNYDVFERDLVSPPVLPSSGLHAQRMSALARKSVVAAVDTEREALLTSLDRLAHEEPARRNAMHRLAERYRHSGDELEQLEAQLDRASSGVAGRSDAMVSSFDAARVEHLQRLWQQLRDRVEALSPVMANLATLMHEAGQPPPTVDGSSLSLQIPRLLQERGAPPVYHEGRLDPRHLLQQTRSGADVYSAAGRSTREALPDAGMESTARDCLACIQHQVGELETLVERAGTGLVPTIRTAVEDLRVKERSRRQRASPASASGLYSTPSPAAHFPLPAVNGSHDAMNTSSPSQRFSVATRTYSILDDSLASTDRRPIRERLSQVSASLDDSTASSTDRRPIRERCSMASSSSPAPKDAGGASIKERLHSARRLLAAERRRISSAASNSPRTPSYHLSPREATPSPMLANGGRHISATFLSDDDDADDASGIGELLDSMHFRLSGHTGVDFDDEGRRRRRFPTHSPKPPSRPELNGCGDADMMTTRFRLSLDRLGLEDDSDDGDAGLAGPGGDLVLETSSILVSSSPSDLDIEKHL